MQYEVMSRYEARQASRQETAPTTAIISITDCASNKNIFYPADWLKAVLEQQFDDVEAGSPGCMTADQAIEVADFVLLVRKDVERFIVHCEFGQSRSAGIAAAISQYIEGNDAGIFTDGRYYPNRTCYRYVLNALKKRGWIPQFFRKR